MFRRSLQQCTRLRVAQSSIRPEPRCQAIPSQPFAPSQFRNATVLHRWNSTDTTPLKERQTTEANTINEAPELQDTVAKPGNNTSSSTQSSQSSPSQNAELEAKNKEVVDLKDKYLRSVAEFRNLQERTKREVQSAKDFAIQRFAKDLLESIDNLDRALSIVPAEQLTKKEENKDLVALHDGLKMTETILMNTMGKHGLTRDDPKDDKFDPNKHEALFEIPTADKEPGTVMHVQSKGFLLNGRVLRAAKVGVAKAQ